MIKLKYLHALLLILGIYLTPITSYSQHEVVCQNADCACPVGVCSNGLNLTNYFRFEVPGLNDDLNITTPAGQSPRDFRSYVLTRNLSGEDVTIDVKSAKENAAAANFVLIGDSVKRLTVNSDGYTGGTYLNASRLCAKNINDGLYASSIRTKFLNRRALDPSIPANACDAIDLAMIQTEGPVSCDAGYSVLSTPNVTGTRWKPKRQCETKAGRAMCVEKNVSVRCDMYEDRTATGCCTSGIAPAFVAGHPAWQCNPLKCSTSDSGWYRRYTFIMPEHTPEQTGYADLVLKGWSNEFLCEQRTGQAVNANDIVTLIDQVYSTNATYHSNATNFIFSPVSPEIITSSEFSAGECGSFDDTFEPYATATPAYNNPAAFLSYSSYVATGAADPVTGATWLRMAGNGYKSQCTGAYTDYAVGTYCYGALKSTALPNVCIPTEPFSKHPIGNQCWEELTPTCTGPYTNYTLPPGVTDSKLITDTNYCREDRMWRDCSGAYTSYPVGSYCHNRLKKENCIGSYTDYSPGEACWSSLQPSCPNPQASYARGSYCWQKLSAICASGASDPYCVDYLSSFPSNSSCAGSYTAYPVGSKCWTDLQPTCAGSYSSHPVNSYCYNKQKPVCTGNYYDYAPGSDCYNLLKPDTCSSSFETYPEGSFCYTTARPTCAGPYTNYSEGSYCYNKLAPVCTGAYTDYPDNSYCYNKLSPAVCAGTDYTAYPTGSYCWKELQPDCTGAHTDYVVGEYCYNNLYPGQDPAQNNAYNCAINSGIGSVCWMNSFGSCDLALGDPPHAPGSYCYRKEKSEEFGFCMDEYSDYPRGSYCWDNRRTSSLPNQFEYIPNGCAVKCEQNSTASVTCNLSTPVNATAHQLTPTSLFVGQRVHKDGFASFKVRFKSKNTSTGIERTNITEVRIRVKATP